MFVSQILTESNIDDFDVRSQQDQQIQNHEPDDNGWSLDKIISMINYLSRTAELYVSSYVNVPLGS